MLPALTLATSLTGTPLLWSAADRLRHLHIIGKSGSGKSTLLAHLVRQDIECGTGVLVLDPHGDLLDMIEKELSPDHAGKVSLIRIIDANTAEAQCQAIDLASILNGGKTTLVSLGKGRIGEELSTRLGRELLARFVAAMLARRGKEEVSPCALYLDEAPTWWHQDLEPLLTQARSSGVSVTLAHQYLEQFDEPTTDLILGNVGLMALFRIGMYDAERLEPEVAPAFNRETLTTLPERHLIIKNASTREVHEGVLVASKL